MSLIDPITGLGCIGPRREYNASHLGLGTLSLPVSMWQDDDPSRYHDAVEFNKFRCRHDFQFWAVTCCRIRDKSTGAVIPFTLNAPQRYVAGILEEQRRAGRPLRLIMLKARQWGGSTLVQMYMAWIQCTRRRNWNSLICAHVKDTAATIRGMYTNMLNSYPPQLWDADTDARGNTPRPEFRPFERSINVREIAGRGCRVTIGSSENPEAVRGADYAMAHLSEVAFWPDTPQHSPQHFLRAICGAINAASETLIVMESTANGVGNFFHTEWQRAEQGLSDKTPVFIPWYMIEIYRRVPEVSHEELMASLDDYERSIMEQYDLDDEQINWYHCKRREQPTHQLMMAEYPTTPLEAFSNSTSAVFRHEDVERLRPSCRPAPWRGEMMGSPLVGADAIDGLQPVPSPGGNLHIWRHPVPASEETILYKYLVVVDIGGRSERSDFSVIAVFDRESAGEGRLELVAQWRGHCDHDILAWKAAAMARYYCNATLVFESNTLESDRTEGDPAEFILATVARYYPYLYHRRDPFTGSVRPGFHTNRSTKSEIVARLITALREGLLLERDSRAVDEFASYQQLPSGATAATPGTHDDILITRGIALTVTHSIPAVQDIKNIWA